MFSKSDFKKYTQCPVYAWFYRNQPAVLQEKPLSDFDRMLVEQGKQVEQYFYQQYPGLERITSKGMEAVDETTEMLSEGITQLAQAAFTAEGFFAQTDFVLVSENGHLELFEIKSSSAMQIMDSEEGAQIPESKDHYPDIAFQYWVATKAGYTVDACWLVEVDKSYSTEEPLALEKLFVRNPVMAEVQKLLPELELQMQQALAYVSSAAAPVTCDCRYKARNKQCPAFAYLHPQYSDYAVYDLARIGNSIKRLRELVDNNYILIKDIPADVDLTDAHRDQVTSWNESRELIRDGEIRNVLGNLSYPLYFLDYETVSAAVPRYARVRPYQHIPFQYSLHILPGPGSEWQHVDFLHTDSSAPMRAVVNSLRNHISDTGTIVVWNKSFEGKCNRNLAELIPDAAPFLDGLNARLFDLMEIFSKRLYVHKDFRGSASIKKVLPVMCPDLSYASLAIADGGRAMSEWNRMILDVSDEAEKQTIKNNLLEYCKLDTLAMVRVYQKLLERCSASF